MTKRLFETRHPFFLPFYRRFVFVAALLGWAIFEWRNDATTWAAIFAVAGGYLGWQFFIRFDPADYQKPPD